MWKAMGIAAELLTPRAAILERMFMTRKIYQLAIAGLFLSAAQWIAMPSARAEVINIVCNDTNYWVDTERKVVIYPDGGELSAEIDSQTIRYHLRGAGNVQMEINRIRSEITGFNSNGSPAFTESCTKGSAPLPAAKF